MQSIRCITLGGEGWPAADIAGGAENRKCSGLLPWRTLQVRAGSSRTMQEQAGSVDTRLTQRTEFGFADCSRFKLSPTDRGCPAHRKAGRRAQPSETVSVWRLRCGEILQLRCRLFAQAPAQSPIPDLRGRKLATAFAGPASFRVRDAARILSITAGQKI